VSSALAAVLERLTAKDLDKRYGDDRAVIADLEEVLAIETARAGQATGEATAILRTLPPSARRRIPARVTHPVRIVLALAVIIAAVVAVLLLAADHTHHGTGQPRNVVAPRGLSPINLAQDGAKDFDPAPGGDGHEHSDQVSALLDRVPSSTWSTESYNGGFPSGKPGVGIYVDAHPSAAARVLEIQTPTTGWSGTIYAAKAGSGPPETLADWGSPVSQTFTITKKHQRIDLDTAGQRFRYYLVWITKLPEASTPTGAQHAEISEILLYQ
jgi:hypothetical protein